MVNKIEIVVTGKNLTKPEFDAAVRDARSTGERIGTELSKGVEDKIEDAIPPAFQDTFRKAKEPASKSGTETGVAFTQALTASLSGKIQDISSGNGALAGTAFAAKFSDTAKKGITAGAVTQALGPAGVEALAKTEGDRSGLNFTQAFEGRVRQQMPSLLPPVDEQKEKAKGAAAGDAASKGMSPLLIGAFTAAGTVGPAALLAGAATATIGIAALVAKSNQQISGDYQTLGQQVEATMTGAVGQIVPQIDAGVKTLEQGVTTLTPQIDQLFAVAGPDAEQFASGLVQLAQGALPGIVSGVKDFAPEMHDVAADAGKIGQGLGGFVDKLGGAGGAVIGLNALTKALSQILPDVGEITADVSNGLGPALRDVLTVATPLANVLTDVVHAVPPGEIELAAVAVTALYAAFKIGTLTKIVAEGTTFVQFLRGATVATEAETVATVELGVAEEATAAKTGILATAQAAATASTSALSAAAGAATGPWGLLAGALFVASDQVSKHTAVKLNLFSVISTLNKAYNTHATAVGDAGKAIEGIAGHFTSATQKADDLTAALTTQREQVSGNAQTTATSTLAALDATDGQSKLTQQLYQSLTGYSAATTGASAYGSALTALNGTTQTVDDAQNSLAQQMLNAKTSFAQNKYSMDLNTQAGIDNRDALSAAAKAITQLGISQYQATGSIGNANDVIQAQINQFVANTGATGKNKDAIYAYLESLAKIPPNVSTDVNLNTSGAFGQLANLLETINTSSGVVHVYESTSGVVTNSSFGRGFGAKASGGVVGAFSGMVRGGRTLVGEYGAEVVDLPMGSTVHSNPDTQRMLSEGGGGSPMRVQFELVGSSDPVLSGLWEALRKHIRVRGGNGSNSVQKALGQPF